jgi:hypothetical protein
VVWVTLLGLTSTLPIGAPILRRMARHESGSLMAARRERALQRIG